MIYSLVIFIKDVAIVAFLDFWRENERRQWCFSCFFSSFTPLTILSSTLFIWTLIHYCTVLLRRRLSLKGSGCITNFLVTGLLSSPFCPIWSPDSLHSTSVVASSAAGVCKSSSEVDFIGTIWIPPTNYISLQKWHELLPLAIYLPRSA